MHHLMQDSKPNFSDVVEFSDMESLKIYLILEYQIPLVFDILWTEFVLNMRLFMWIFIVIRKS